jgi:hypothetical protein
VTIRARLIAMRALVIAAIAGCGFSPRTAHVDGSVAMSDAAAAHPHMDATASMPDAVASVPCYASDKTGLVLCLEFDDADLAGGSGIAHDGGPGHHDATVVNGALATRSVPATSQAIVITAPESETSAAIHVADSTDFNVTQMTLMAWVDRSETGDDEDYGVIEQYPNFVMTVGDDGVGCEIENTNGVIDGVLGDTVPVGTWTLVACTYDGSSVCTLAMPGGSGPAATPQCEPAPGPLIGGMYGPVIGAHFDGTETYTQLPGSMDSARIFNRVLTPQEICVGGGRTGC